MANLTDKELTPLQATWIINNLLHEPMGAEHAANWRAHRDQITDVLVTIADDVDIVVAAA